MDALTRKVMKRARALGLKEVYNWDQWGSRRKSTYISRLKYRPVRVKKADTLVFHISVTRDDGPSRGDFFADMREVEAIGYDRFKSGFSYNFGFDQQNGRVGAGQPLLSKGTHTVNNKGRAGYS